MSPKPESNYVAELKFSQVSGAGITMPPEQSQSTQVHPPQTPNNSSAIPKADECER